MSLKRKLTALGYKDLEIKSQDGNQIKDLIIWLETTKINHYGGKSPQGFLNSKSNDWIKHYEQYLKDLGIPETANKNCDSRLDWILGHAVQLEYIKKKDEYNKYAVENLKTSNVPNVIADNPLDHLDFSSKEFQEGIENLAKILKITPHPDPRVTLRACSTLVQNKLNSKILEKPQEYILKGTPYPYKDADLGFDLKDATLNEAAKILRLLYINDLRNLQTRANECIVAVQSVTADPKTDTKLGKVGK